MGSLLVKLVITWTTAMLSHFTSTCWWPQWLPQIAHANVIGSSSLMAIFNSSQCVSHCTCSHLLFQMAPQPHEQEASALNVMWGCHWHQSCYDFTMATSYEHAHYTTKWLVGHTHLQKHCTHPQLNRCADDANLWRACHRRARSKWSGFSLELRRAVVVVLS